MVRLTLGHTAPFAAIFWLSLVAAVTGAVALAGRRRRPAEATPAGA
jgi:hypothetical protein